MFCFFSVLVLIETAVERLLYTLVIQRNVISSQKSVVHNELLVKSEILHWNCDCSLHLDWNLNEILLKKKGNWSKDIILLRSVQMSGCYVYTLFTAEWLIACFVFTGNLSVYKVVVFLFFLCLGFFLVKQQFCGLLYSMNLMFAGSASWDSHIKGKSNLDPSLFSTKALLVEIWFCSMCAAHLCTGKHKS